MAGCLCGSFFSVRKKKRRELDRGGCKECFWRERLGEIDEVEMVGGSDSREGLGYGSKEYWEMRYSVKSFRSSEGFDWYLNDVHSLVSVLGKVAKVSSRVLDCGCGNSLVGEILVGKYGYQDVTCVDYAPSVIANMMARAKERGISSQSLTYDVVDCRSLADRFGKCAFDLVLDKGTFAAIQCSHRQRDIDNYLDGIQYVLQCGTGTFVLVSHERPEITVSKVVPGRKFKLRCKILLEENTCSASVSSTAPTALIFQHTGRISTQRAD